MNNIYDTHCHPYLNKIKKSDKIISDFFENGGIYMNVIGTNIDSCNKVLELASKYDGVFATVGIHPCDIIDLDLEKTILQLENMLLKHKEKIVAIGECGLDYYWLERDEKVNSLGEEYRTKIINGNKKLQEIFFKAQISLAKEYNLPLIIHNRDSKNDILRILKETDFKNFIFHCYSENLEYANKLLEFSPNCKISFSGIVTFKNALDIQETAKNIPITNILAETDSPYLTPTPYRGKEENEPIFTKYILDKISDLRGINCNEQILNNSIKTFNISI